MPEPRPTSADRNARRNTRLAAGLIVTSIFTLTPLDLVPTGINTGDVRGLAVAIVWDGRP